MYKGTILALFAIAATLSLIDFGLSKKAEKGLEIQADLTKDWIKFVPFTGKFTVYLPRTPKYAIDIVNVPKTDIKRWYEMYVAEEPNGTVFLVNLISYHSSFDLSNVKGVLHNVVNEMISSNLNNRVLELKDETFQGRRSVFFHFQNESIEVKGIAFLAGMTVYQLTYTALSENFNENEYEGFVNSFELVKPLEP